jgi:hypothetical protein
LKEVIQAEPVQNNIKNKQTDSQRKETVAPVKQTVMR